MNTEGAAGWKTRRMGWGSGLRGGGGAREEVGKRMTVKALTLPRKNEI